MRAVLCSLQYADGTLIINLTGEGPAGVNQQSYSDGEWLRFGDPLPTCGAPSTCKMIPRYSIPYPPVK